MHSPRRAKIHVLAGYANTSDAHRYRAPCPDGEGALRYVNWRSEATGMRSRPTWLYQRAWHITPLGDGENSGSQGRVRRPRKRTADDSTDPRPATSGRQ